MYSTIYLFYLYPIIYKYKIDIIEKKKLLRFYVMILLYHIIQILKMIEIQYYIPIAIGTAIS